MQVVDRMQFVSGWINNLLGVSAMIALAACAPSPSSGAPEQSSTGAGGVQVTSDRSGYRPGEPLTLTVHNGSTDTVTFNPCTRAIEREQSGSWTALPEPQRICTMEAWILAPGEQRAGPTELPADLAPGHYRAVLAFTVESAKSGSGRLEARTAPFAVER
jgi:hypothetical protein